MKRNHSHASLAAGTALLAALLMSPLALAADAMPGSDMPADSMGTPMKSKEKSMDDGMMKKEGQMKQPGSMDSKDSMKSGDSMAKPAKKMKKKAMKKTHGESAKDKM